MCLITINSCLLFCFSFFIGNLLALGEHLSFLLNNQNIQHNHVYNTPCDRSRKLFTAEYGEISDGPVGFNYSQDSHCEWLIQAHNKSQFITLTFFNLNTECSYDFIFVYDGHSFNSKLLGSFSGRTQPERLIAKSGSMLILMYSDSNYVLDGFRAIYYISNCLNNCNNHGKCIEHQCVCHDEWMGPDCENETCPKRCGEQFGHGKCINGICHCSKGYSGRFCDLYEEPIGNSWRWLATNAEGMVARAAHTAIYLKEEDSLYVFGGYNLNRVISNLQIYRFETSEWEDSSYKDYQEENDRMLKLVLQDKNEKEMNNSISFMSNLYSIESNQHTIRILDSQFLNNNNSMNGELSKYLKKILLQVKENKPHSRYGHAAANVPDGFVIFGGKLSNGSFCDDLWFYNISAIGHKWKHLVINSKQKPPPVALHTLTYANNYLYLFGGSLENGEFSSDIYRLSWLFDSVGTINGTSGANKCDWEMIHPRGGKKLDVRLAAHTTVYHKSTNSLIVFGGIMTKLARFSKLSDRMFAFQLDIYHWTEILYPRTALRDSNIPRERAYHTATISGNYMIVFGGYTHRHNKNEICYDNQMYWYHLSCHIWINQFVSIEDNSYPKKQGVFAHAAALRNNNTLLIVGGYHGNVNADLFAYELPQILRIQESTTIDKNSEILCRLYNEHTACLSYPECGWCSADSSCYGRTIGANCTTNLQTTRCPGICPSLGDCHSCLVHGTQLNRQSVKENYSSIASKLGLNKCTWCVQNAKCHHIDDNYGICGEDTPSHNPGWWGDKGTEIQNSRQCTKNDRRPGLTYINYHYPINFSLPDYVAIVNATMVDFASPITQYEQKMDGEMLARLLGFVRPNRQWIMESNEMQVCTSYATAILRGGFGHDLFKLDELARITTNQSNCYNIKIPSVEKPFLIDFQVHRRIGANISIYNIYEKTKMELQHVHHGNLNAFTFEYLEPYYSGFNCHLHTNCLRCLTDNACGWCSLKSVCMSRNVNETEACQDNNLNSNMIVWEFLISQPSHCANCSNYVTCEHCIGSQLCEWLTEEARCARLGKYPYSIHELSQCPLQCHLRSNCNECLNERGRCAWCESRSTCFNFGVYTSEYQFGMCREWFTSGDSYSTHLGVESRNTIISASLPVRQLAPIKQQCKSCTQYRNCSTCLRILSCGWCFDRNNPINGICIPGDFIRPFGICLSTLNNSSLQDNEWAYGQCPDVNECDLALHDCHREAKCINTHGSYNCHCRRGFIGDGHMTCMRTCFESCMHGYCSGPPEYICKCELGWTGDDCSMNCGCHSHSTCVERIGKCDACQAWTEGEHCERCRQGSYGNATSVTGCNACECNGHGNHDFGICNANNGTCFCKDNTEGIKCDKCSTGYYGDPRDGGQCYYQCESRGIVNTTRTGIGSYQSSKLSRGVSSESVQECLWILNPKTLSYDKSLIQLEFEWLNLSVDCDENAVYIYDSLPHLIGNSQQSQLIAVVCNPYTSSHIIEAKSNQFIVYYKQSHNSYKQFGFNAIYTVKNCEAHTCVQPHICDEKQRCICPAGYVGPRCEVEICPRNCNAKRMQGYCDTNYGRCICKIGYAGSDCGSIMKSNQLIVTELFNTMLLSDQNEHLRNTIPRFGHTLCADRRGSLWMFGGFSPIHGPLNDFRQFDTKNDTWMQVTVESTPEDKMPLGRYFHAAEIYLKKQIIFIYGGITITNQEKLKKPQILCDFWQFFIQNQRWSELKLSTFDVRPPPLAGHTITYIQESLILIGGLTNNHSRMLELWEFNLETYEWKELHTIGIRIPKLYGHSSVYHMEKHIIYVFGGYSTEPQNKLYALQLRKMIWTELPVFKDLNRPELLLPRSRYFHSAVTTKHYMVIYGGRTHPYNSSDVLIAYVYDCNQWIRLTEDVNIVGHLPASTFAEDISIDHDSNTIYIIGGWDGSATYSQVSRIILPLDICQMWSAGKYLCRHYMGCSFCTVTNLQSSTSYCFSHGNSGVCDNGNGTLIYNNGATCDDTWIARRNCSSFTTCSSCLASWPTHIETAPVCQWCDQCGIKGRCIPAGVNCIHQKIWCKKETGIGLLNFCPQAHCHTLHCEACIQNNNCKWARNELYIVECITKELVEKNEYLVVEQCPLPCHSYKNCSACLNYVHDNITIQMPKNCKWSTMLNLCLSPQNQALFCAGGVCGLVLEINETHHCPEPCQTYTQCSTCLEHAHCGWCARENTNGDGICTEIPPNKQQDYQLVPTCDLIFPLKKNGSNVRDKTTWNYVKCPIENECINNHHNCDNISELCIDTEENYQCVCADGFLYVNGTCMPICTQGCVYGICVRPNVCKCDFGYVGKNCSSKCLCNGHSNCKSPEDLNECIKCHNNTMGEQCEKCLPLYVGDPRNGQKCIECHEYCNGHTNICIASDADPAFFNMSKTELEINLPEGSVRNATCLKCANFTAGLRCDSCITGYFRGNYNHNEKCRPCQCNGHGNICDPITGEKCNCGNNTESDATCTVGGGKNSVHLCWSMQCSKCRDSYAGNPIDSHQCYKQITVESRMCFDAKPIEECKAKPAALRPGQTVFFVIQPRFMNVDIRVIIDVTQGELDVYMSPQDDSFIVKTNETSGYHDIYLDNRYNWETKNKHTYPLNIAINKFDNTTKFIMSEGRSTYHVPYLEDCRNIGTHSFFVKDQYAKDLSTYVTINQCNTLLRLFGLKNRLIMTLPQNAHNLSATRFFIVLHASSGPEPSYGSVIFRQDQLHIDLFVFFSVFFSCFFLFFSACMVIWKMKQAADIRQARRQHVVELLHLAKRPFAHVYLAANSFDLYNSPRITSNYHSSATINRTKHNTIDNNNQLPEIMLIALEPTYDNLAAIGTVFISLPGHCKAPLSMILGSTLIIHPRSYTLINRNYTRPQRGGSGLSFHENSSGSN